MDLELRLREAVRMQDPGDEFTARVMGAVGNAAVIDIRTRRRSRIVVIGVVMLVGAAAAMLALWLSSSPVARTGAGLPQAATPERLVVDEAEAIEVRPPEQGAADIASGSLPESPRRIAVLVMQPGDQSGESLAKGELARGAVAAFHAVLLQELRRMPDLFLMDAGTASAAEAASADYRLATAGLKAEKISLPGVEDAKYWPVEARIQGVANTELRLLAGKDYFLKPFVGSDGAPGGRTTCRWGGSLRRVQIGGMGSLEQVCGSVADIARVLADVMRQQAIDPRELQRQLVMQLLAATSSEYQRHVTLGDLANSAENQLDASAIAAIVDYISGLATAQRRQAWKELRGRKEIGFVQPMLGVLRNDTDAQVRLTVLQILMSTHGEDQQIMAALEAVVRDDPAEIVRMAVRRSLQGDSELNSQALSALRNANLANKERLQPIVVAWSTASTASQLDTLANALYDEKAATLLVTALRESNPNDLAQWDMIRSAVSLLGRVDRPEAMDMLIELAREDPGDRAADFLLAMETMRSLMPRRNDPRVRAAIDQAIAGNEALRSMFEPQLAQPPAGR